jgi:O-methyltransferase
MGEPMSKGEAAEARARPWPYQANCPQRYTAKYGAYVARGGMVRPDEDVQGFVAGGFNAGDMARFYSFSLAFDQICKEALPGQFAEVGVYKGHTATLIAAMARRLDRTAYLFDTYEGFNSRDLQGIDATAQATTFSDTSLEAVRAFVGEENVRFVAGYFPDTAIEVPPQTEFCLVHIDCDLYAPFEAALRYFYPRIVSGGFLIMHDYANAHWKGAEKAVDEFLTGKPEKVIPIPDKSGTAVLRKI